MRKILFFLILTVLTQIGGISYLLSSLIYKKFNFKGQWIRLKKLGVHLATYLILTAIIVPWMAPLFGRTSLPVFSSHQIRPLNVMTCLLNRHYVSHELYQTSVEMAADFSQKYPEQPIQYLDANFPFIDGFPLLPHLSHSDGNKIDFAFVFYKPDFEEEICLDCPNFIGYGGAVLPNESEKCTDCFCRDSGYPLYDILTRTFGVFNDSNVQIEEQRTREFLKIISNHSKVNKIFLEPHLVDRFQLKSSKFRFHGCHAVSHDDHIHVEIR